MQEDRTAADVITAAIRRGAGKFAKFDPLVRRGKSLPDGDTPVHQLRVTCRRLRSELRLFAPLLSTPETRELRGLLRFLADRLGGVRDAEVLRARLRLTASGIPALAARPVARLDGALAKRHRAARERLARAMDGGRFTALADALGGTAAHPPLLATAGSPASEILPPLVTQAWADLVEAVAGLDTESPDERWHQARIAAKRARYAAEAVAGSTPLAERLADLQDLLGEEHDAIVAGQTWLDLGARAGRRDPNVAIAAGRLCERELAASRRARAGFAPAWAACARPELRDWLD